MEVAMVIEAPEKADALYTLTQAAYTLDIDPKTLRKLIRIAGVIPVRDRTDGRARLLTRDQLQILARHHSRRRGQPDQGRVIDPVPANSPLESVALQLARAIEGVASKEENVAVRTVRLSKRERELDERINQFERLVQELRADIGAKLDRLVAQGKFQPDIDASGKVLEVSPVLDRSEHPVGRKK